MRIFPAKVLRVVDGDTADFEIDLGFHIKTKIRGRFLDVDTPERGHLEYKAATNVLETMLAKASEGKEYIDLEVHKTGKYGRWLVNIEGVNKIMAERWPYKGKK